MSRDPRGRKPKQEHVRPPYTCVKQCGFCGKYTVRHLARCMHCAAVLIKAPKPNPDAAEILERLATWWKT